MPKKEKQISQLPYVYKCPECEKRVLDSNIIDTTPTSIVQTKCDHCSEIVDVVLIHENLLTIVDNKKTVKKKSNMFIHTEQRNHLY